MGTTISLPSMVLIGTLCLYIVLTESGEWLMMSAMKQVTGSVE